MGQVTAGRLVAATETLADGDAICRFLELEGSYTILAEVKEAEPLADTVLRHRPDVILLSQRLPGVRDLTALLRELPIPFSRVVAILPDDWHSRPLELRLRSMGVRSTLVGPFRGEALLKAIDRAMPTPAFVSVVGLSGGAGQTTVALGLVLTALRRGVPVVPVDRGRRGDFTAALEACGATAGHPLLSWQPDPEEEGRRVIVDGAVEDRAASRVLVAACTFASARAALAPRRYRGIVLQNDGVGRGVSVDARDLRLAAIRPPLLESLPTLTLADPRLDAFHPLARRLDIGGGRIDRIHEPSPRTKHLQPRSPSS